jgi:hypothetical protein
VTSFRDSFDPTSASQEIYLLGIFFSPWGYQVRTPIGKSSHAWEDTMKIMDRCCGRVKVFVAVAASALLMSAIASPASAQNVRWRTVIGVVQAGNVVGGITGGGQPWSTLGGNASVNLATARVEFEVRGLVLAGGNSIGTPGANTQVKGTLVCIVVGTTVALDTVAVPLDSRGDAEFSGSIGPIPTTCTPTNVAFLIRSVVNNNWFANGSVRTSSGGP